MNLKSLISNWGNYPKIQANISAFDSIENLKTILTSKDFPHGIARGNGRCYGDSALSENIISTLKYNTIRKFDAANGVITAEAGVLFETIITAVLPSGWFLPVTPGTKFVTLGGAIASDIHGKNHHKEGSFSNHVLSLDLMLEDGRIVHCSKEENSELFLATCGGMGLTGIIVLATVQLKKVETSFIRQETLRAENIDHLMDLFESSKDWTYSVSWVDALSKGKSLGRGVLFRGEHALKSEVQLANSKADYLELKIKKNISIPFNFPSFTLNKLTVMLFNFYFFHKHSKEIKKDFVYFDSFFYPMDSILHWNRIYGKPGFMEYQFVFPKDTSRKGLNQVFKIIAESGLSPFFSGLKLFGNQNSYLSFPMEGYTMAFDFAVNRKVFALLDMLDQVIIEFGGRVYLTKDARMNAAVFANTYKNSELFKKLKSKFNPNNKYQSLQSRRIGISS